MDFSANLNNYDYKKSQDLKEDITNTLRTIGTQISSSLQTLNLTMSSMNSTLRSIGSTLNISHYIQPNANFIPTPSTLYSGGMMSDPEAQYIGNTSTLGLYGGHKPYNIDPVSWNRERQLEIRNRMVGSTAGMGVAVAGGLASWYGGNAITAMGVNYAARTSGALGGAARVIQGSRALMMGAQIGGAIAGITTLPFTYAADRIGSEMQDYSRDIAAVQRMSGIYSGGRSFGYGEASSIARQMPHMANRELNAMTGMDTQLGVGGYRTLMTKGIENNLFKGTTPQELLKSLESAAGVVRMLTGVLGSKDINEAISQIADLKNKGLNLANNPSLARAFGEQTSVMARMAGVSAPQMVGLASQYGGGAWQSLGLAGAGGMPQFMQASAFAHYMERAGSLTPATLAVGGGQMGIAANYAAAMGRQAMSPGNGMLLMGAGLNSRGQFDPARAHMASQGGMWSAMAQGTAALVDPFNYASMRMNMPDASMMISPGMNNMLKSKVDIAVQYAGGTRGKSRKQVRDLRASILMDIMEVDQAVAGVKVDELYNAGGFNMAANKENEARARERLGMSPSVFSQVGTNWERFKGNAGMLAVGAAHNIYDNTANAIGHLFGENSYYGGGGGGTANISITPGVLGNMAKFAAGSRALSGSEFEGSYAAASMKYGMGSQYVNNDYLNYIIHGRGANASYTNYIASKEAGRLGDYYKMVEGGVDAGGIDTLGQSYGSLLSGYRNTDTGKTGSGYDYALGIGDIHGKMQSLYGKESISDAELRSAGIDPSRSAKDIHFQIMEGGEGVQRLAKLKTGGSLGKLAVAAATSREGLGSTLSNFQYATALDADERTKYQRTGAHLEGVAGMGVGLNRFKDLMIAGGSVSGIDGTVAKHKLAGVFGDSFFQNVAETGSISNSDYEKAAMALHSADSLWSDPMEYINKIEHAGLRATLTEAAKDQGKLRDLKRNIQGTDLSFEGLGKALKQQIEGATSAGVISSLNMSLGELGASSDQVKTIREAFQSNNFNSIATGFEGLKGEDGTAASDMRRAASIARKVNTDGMNSLTAEQKTDLMNILNVDKLDPKMDGLGILSTAMGQSVNKKLGSDVSDYESGKKVDNAVTYTGDGQWALRVVNSMSSDELARKEREATKDQLLKGNAGWYASDKKTKLTPGPTTETGANKTPAGPSETNIWNPSSWL